MCKFRKSTIINSDTTNIITCEQSNLNVHDFNRLCHDIKSNDKRLNWGIGNRYTHETTKS